MAGSSLQPGAVQEERDHRRSRLKIRTTPSSAALAGWSSSFHGSCRPKMMIKKDCNTGSRHIQPLIFHTFDPEVIVTEPAEFMSLVQRLTGSPATRKLLRVSSSPKRKEMELPVRSAPDTEMRAQQDPLKEGRTIILAPAAGISCTGTKADHGPSPAASPTYHKCSGLSGSISFKPDQILSVCNHASYEANPLAASALPFRKQLNLNVNPLPLLSIPANSATYEDNYDSAYTSPMSSNSPLSPNSSLTTSSGGCFSMEESGGALTSYREALCCAEEGSTPRTEEDGDINFFVFSRDSYYGNHAYTAAQDELNIEVLNFSNALDPF